MSNTLVAVKAMLYCGDDYDVLSGSTGGDLNDEYLGREMAL
jgi:hypothetical protein